MGWLQNIVIIITLVVVTCQVGPIFVRMRADRWIDDTYGGFAGVGADVLVMSLSRVSLP